MKKSNLMFFLTITLGILSFITSPSNAQFIMEQVEYNVTLSYDWIPEDAEFENAVDEAMFFLELPDSKLLNKSTVEKSTIYIDNNNIAVESQSEIGKTTMISNSEKGTSYLIFWAQKKVLEISAEDMKNLKKTTESATQQMLEKLSPEIQAQIKAAQENEAKPEVKVKATGKKDKKYGLDCEQYLIEKGDELIIVWATNDNLGLTNKVKQVSEKLSAIFQNEDDEDVDEWDLIAGKIPVEVRKFNSAMMDEPVLAIQAITKIEKQTPPQKVFVVPTEKDGFTKGTFMDMMKMFGDEEGY